MASIEEQREETRLEGMDLDFDEGYDESAYQALAEMYDESMQNLKEGEVVEGTVIDITSNNAVVDVGFKSEGMISLEEFKDREGKISVNIGDVLEVLLEKSEDADGHVLLSKKKADRMRVWDEIERAYKEGTVVQGRVLDRIKGGLTVDVGIRAFLPGSLVDIRPVKNLESLKGEILEFKVISLERRRNNIVLSRKAILEKEYEAKKKETLEQLEEGVRLVGVVKNITDYGAFIDLGGVDGLLHITDISWGRVNHPSEHFSIGDEAEVLVLKFDSGSERVSLGYKQRFEDPWALVDKKYPIGSRVQGKVVSLVDYGAFVEIEDGVEGLIHVSEMSWTKKVVNPAKILEIGDEVEAIVSELDMEQRRISLSLRQTERNPWEELSDSFPEGSIIEGRVRNLTDFGAFVEIKDGIDGLIHVSDMSWTKRIKHPSEVLKKGDLVKARITNIDTGNQRVSLSIKEFLNNEWDSFVEKYLVGDNLVGKVVNVTDFGLFVDVFEGLEGLAHVSEVDLGGGRLEDIFTVGDWVRARILRVDEAERKVGLTMRGVHQPTKEEVAEFEAEEAKAREVLEAAKASAEASEEASEETSEEASHEEEVVEASVEKPAEVAPSEEATTDESTSESETVEVAEADSAAPAEEDTATEEAADDSSEEKKEE